MNEQQIHSVKQIIEKRLLQWCDTEENFDRLLAYNDCTRDYEDEENVKRLIDLYNEIFTDDVSYILDDFTE